MALLNKVCPMTVKLTPEQKRRAEAAAKIESRKRGERVWASTLLRELAMPQIEAIVAESGRAEDQAA